MMQKISKDWIDSDEHANDWFNTTHLTTNGTFVTDKQLKDEKKTIKTVPDEPRDASPEFTQALKEHNKNVNSGEWLPWVLAGGSGLLSHALASALIGDEDENGKSSWWRKLLSLLVGGVGAYGGYMLGEGMNKKGSAHWLKAAACLLNKHADDPSTNAPPSKVDKKDGEKKDERDTVQVPESGKQVFKPVVRAINDNPTVPSLVASGVTGLGGAALTGKAIQHTGNALGWWNPSMPPETSSSEYSLATKDFLDQLKAYKADTEAIRSLETDSKVQRALANDEAAANAAERARAATRNADIDRANAPIDSQITALETRNTDIATEIQNTRNDPTIPDKTKKIQLDSLNQELSANERKLSDLRTRRTASVVPAESMVEQQKARTAETTLAARRTANAGMKTNLDAAKGKYKGHAWRRAAAYGVPGGTLDALTAFLIIHSRNNAGRISDSIEKLRRMGISEDVINQVVERAEKAVSDNAPWYRFLW